VDARALPLRNAVERVRGLHAGHGRTQALRPQRPNHKPRRQSEHIAPLHAEVFQ